MIDRQSVLARLGDARADAQQLLSSLTRDFTGIVAASADSNADDEHDPEGSTIAFERSQVSTLIDQSRHTLDEIDAAVARVEDGSYGTCATCGRAIASARLEARPTARTCVTCT